MWLIIGFIKVLFWFIAFIIVIAISAYVGRQFGLSIAKWRLEISRQIEKEKGNKNEN